MNAVTLVPITAYNWITCKDLTLTPAQQQWVAPNVVSLAQAYAEPWWHPLGVYAGDIMVGFVMHGRWPQSGIPAHHGAPEAGIDYILRMMIDSRFQQQGYGRAALDALLARIKAQPGCRAIELDYDRDNVAAARLYTRFGFQVIEENAHGEILARLVILES